MISRGIELSPVSQKPFYYVAFQFESFVLKFNFHLVYVLVRKREKLMFLLLKFAGQRACCCLL